MTPTRPGALLLALGLTLAGTAACGDDPASGGTTTAATASPTPTTNGTDTLPAKQALAAATKAYLAARTVHVKGSVVDSGSRIELDLRQTSTGDSIGTLVMDGATVKILTVGKTAYFSGDRRFWTDAGGADAYSLLKGKWVKTRLTAKDFEQFALFTDRKQFADGILPTDLHGGEPQVVRGLKTFRFGDDDGGNFYVALEGKPYPVRIAGKDGTSEVNLDFLDYGDPVDLTPPPASKVVSPPA